MTTQSQAVAGVELGGTKCICTLAVAGEIVDQTMVPTRGPVETLDAIEPALDRWCSEQGFAALGIASFGPVDLDRESPTWGHVTNTAKPGWPGTDVARRLQGRFGVPTAFDTDVNGAALAEMRWGAGRGLYDFAYITVGTGIGVGLVVNGRPARGFGHSEMGHVRVARLEGDGWPGACPFHGDCVEGLASGPAIASRIGNQNIDGLAPDDPVWDGVAHALAQLCHTLVCSTAPLRIAIGGGVMSGQPHLLERIEQRLVDSLAGYIALPTGGPYVVPPGLGDQAGPLGSIALALDALEASAVTGDPRRRSAPARPPG